MSKFSLVKFLAENKINEAEGREYIKVRRRDCDKAIAIADSYLENKSDLDIVDNDGAGNCILYVTCEDAKATCYDICMGIKASDIEVVDCTCSDLEDSLAEGEKTNPWEVISHESATDDLGQTYFKVTVKVNGVEIEEQYYTINNEPLSDEGLKRFILPSYAHDANINKVKDDEDYLGEMELKATETLDPSGKEIYTIIPYYSGGGVRHRYIRSFYNLAEARTYAEEEIRGGYDIVTNTVS